MQHIQAPRAHQPAQRGVSLLFALLAMVALSLAGLALVRSVDTSSMVLGNLGFKQDTTAVADQATRDAINWLTSSGADLSKNAEDKGYYAQVNDDVDVTATAGENKQLVNWGLDGCKYAENMTSSVCKVRPAEAKIINKAITNYIIFRLCSGKGGSNDAANSCAKPLNTSSSVASKKGKLDYSDYERFTSVNGVYYRIIVRVVDPRQTTSFVETIVHI